MTDEKQFLTKGDLVIFRQMTQTHIDIHPQLNRKPNPEYIKDLEKLIERIENTIEVIGEIGN